MEETIQLIGEVVGGLDLTPSSDTGTLRPYCIVKLGERLIHQTKKAEGFANPIWTVSTGSFFLLSTTITTSEKLSVEIWYKERDPLQITVLDTVCLGKVSIDITDIFSNCNEQRLDYKLCDPCSSKVGRGTVSLRFRLATPSDENFLRLLENHPSLLKQRSTVSGQQQDESPSSSLLVTETNETNIAGESFLNVISGAFTSKTKFDQRTGQDKFLVKPHPDPSNAEKTAYLSAKEISTETLKPSHQWVEAGSGTIGRVYLEILSCHDLPNVDVGEAMGNVTDAFVCAVFEDAMVQTPVVDDELCPHWLPWTQRAFLFKMMHPTSMLYLGVFDFDLGISNHEALGRVAVNISNLQRDTDYTLKYNLYPSTNVTDRTSAGSVTIRLRIEYENEKEALMTALRPRPKFHINVRREKSLSVLRYTCFGVYGDDSEQPFDLTVTRSYVNEILEYKRSLVYCIKDAVKSLIFWRGQVQVGALYVPLHSFLFFCCATKLVERPSLLPPFSMLSIAWVMLAAQTQRMQHPSPWHRCFSLLRYIEILRTGESSIGFQAININEGADKAEAYEKEWQDRLKKDQEFAERQAAMQQEILSIGDEAIHSKTAGPFPLDLELLGRLTRYQGIIGRIVQRFRFVKMILLWEESYFSFWITACFLVVGLVSLILPWAFILLWTGRIVVWGLLGPHMKILDLVLQSQGDADAVLEQAIENFKSESVSARIRRQEAVKMRDMKKLAFGKYITLVPSHNLSRHYDRPLPGSYARTRPSRLNGIRVASRGVPGQHLFGTILPRTEAQASAYNEEVEQLQAKHSEIAARLEALSYIQNCKLSVGNLMEDLPAEVGYELIRCETDGQNDSGGPDGPANTSRRHLDAIVWHDDATTTTGLRRRPSARKPNSTDCCSVDGAIRVEGLSPIRAMAPSEATPPASPESAKSASSRTTRVAPGLEETIPVKRVHTWSAGDTSSPKRWQPSLVEVDEERESGEVEIVLGSQVRCDVVPGDGLLDSATSMDSVDDEETDGVDDELSTTFGDTSTIADDESSCVVYYSPERHAKGRPIDL